MPTRNVVLTDSQAKFVEQMVASGAYQNASEVLALAVEALLAGPDAVGARKRDDILPGVRVLHVARHGKRGRHFLIFRASEDGQIDVLRVLHDSMDPARHLGP